MNKVVTALGAGMVGLAMTGPAAAQQEDYEQIVIIMRACAQIEDVAARVTCYDNNIMPRDGTGGATSSAASATLRPAPVEARGLGAEQLPQVREAINASREDEIEARLTAVERIGPGLYLMTLDNGTQWEFVDTAPFSYDTPGEGARVRIERGSLGSYRLIYNRQQGLRVRRVR